VTPVYIVLLVVGWLFVITFGVGFARKPVDPIRTLKNRFITLSRLSRAQAEAELLDRVESLAERFPGKSYGWYLEWLVTDLERAKR
jgi:hypothetical protein